MTPKALKQGASRYVFFTIIGLMSAVVSGRFDGCARETLRQTKYTVLSHRKGWALEPVGD